MIAGAVRDWLIGDVQIVNKVSNRIYPNKIPQEIKSGICIVLNRISGNHEYDLSNELGIRRFIYQLDIYGDIDTRPAEVEATNELIRLRMSGYRGQLNDDVFCHGLFLQGDDEEAERPVDASDIWQFRQGFDFEIHVTAAVPTH